MLFYSWIAFYMYIKLLNAQLLVTMGLLNRMKCRRNLKDTTTCNSLDNIVFCYYSFKKCYLAHQRLAK